MPSLLRPKSRGNIKLTSKDPFVPPIIQPNYYSHPQDVEIMKAGLKWSLKLAQTDYFKKNSLQVMVAKFGCGDSAPFSDDYLECLLKNWSLTIYHPVGTCKMGPASDPWSVVDHELRVHGVIGLRVADASIMPTLTTGNTNAPCIMIGEKAAHMILHDYAKRKK